MQSKSKQISVTIRTPSRRVLIGIALTISLGILAYSVVTSRSVALPELLNNLFREDPDKALVKKWMNENLKSVKWKEEKWWPAVELKGFRCLNSMNILADAESIKRTSTLPLDDLIDDYREIWNDFQKKPVRRICGIQYKAVSPQGSNAVLSQTFEILDGHAKPLPADLLYEFPEQTTMRLDQAGAKRDRQHDAWKFLNNKEFDQSLMVSDDMISQRMVTAFTIPLKRKEVPRKDVSKRAVAGNDVQVDSPPVDEPSDEPIPAAARPPVVERDEKPARDDIRIPSNIRDYLEKSLAIKKTTIENLDEKLAVAQVGLRSSSGDAKREWNRTIKVLEKTMADVKKTDVTCFLPDNPGVGDIGAIRGLQIEAVLDDRSIILSYLKTESTILPSAAIVNELDTTKMKATQSASTTDLFIVVAVSSEVAPLSNDIRLKGLRYTPLISIKPFKKSEIDKYRDKFETDNR